MRARERKLRGGERRMHLLAQNLTAMIAYFDARLRCRYANRQYCEFHGIDPGRIAGMGVEKIGRRHAAELLPLMQRVRRGEPVTQRREHQAGGELREIELHAVPDLSAGGKFLGCYVIILDVTQQRRAEAALKASETRLRAFLDNEPDCVKVVGPDGSLLDINLAGLAMLEAGSIEEVRARGLTSFVLPQYREPFRDFLRRCTCGAPEALQFEIVGLKGTRRWMESKAAPLRLPEGEELCLLAVTRDVTAQKLAAQTIDYLSRHDALTGLPNRGVFKDHLELAVAHARRRGELLGVLLVDLDRFERINESLGSAAGDELLRHVGARLRGTLRDVDTIARLGGNEFGVLVEGTHSCAAVSAVAEKILKSLDAAFEVQGQELFVTASIGIAVYPEHLGEASVLLESATVAMRQAKHDGGNMYRIFRAQRSVRRGQRMELESRLRRALDQDEFVLHYQPKVQLATGAITGAEALLRWNSPGAGLLGPAQFIALAEETGLILPIGQWALRAACVQARRWQERNWPLQVAVNLSPRQFRHEGLARQVAATLVEAGLPGERLELEITESTAMSRPEQAIAVMEELRRLGVQFAVDDFGTGYSSLAYLKRFPIRRLKIDRSFLQNMAPGSADAEIVRAIIALAKSLGLSTTAEGVEKSLQRDLLVQLGCDELQGYWFSPPLPAHEFEALLLPATAAAPQCTPCWSALHKSLGA